MKTCRVCNETKMLTEFYKKTDGYYNYACKQCHCKQTVKYQKNNLLYKLIIFPDGDHGLTKYRNDVMREVISFLN